MPHPRDTLPPHQCTALKLAACYGESLGFLQDRELHECDEWVDAHEPRETTKSIFISENSRFRVIYEHQEQLATSVPGRQRFFRSADHLAVGPRTALVLTAHS